jgi:hypothetical protein
LGRYNGYMRLALKLHPDSTSAAASNVEVEAARPRDGTLALSFIVTGKISGLRLPSVVAPARTDGLWQHTCFEAFLGTPPKSDYYEFNFSPSKQWAAFHFGDYRAGMATLGIDPPKIEITCDTESYMLRASLDLKQLDLAHGVRLGARLGLSAIIEDTNGNKSYWALAHAPGKPDFHRSDCFTHELS